MERVDGRLKLEEIRGGRSWYQEQRHRRARQHNQLQFHLVPLRRITKTAFQTVWFSSEIRGKICGRIAA
jgi:hypothetical protein